MNYKLWVAFYLIFAASIIYWDIHRYDVSETTLLLSDCHNAEIKMMNDKSLCTECKLYCEVVNEKR